ENLKVELAKLEAEIQTVRVAQTKSKVQIDDTDLAKIKEGVARVRDRIKVEQEKLALQAEFATGPIPVADRVEEKDLLKDIDAHFGPIRLLPPPGPARGHTSAEAGRERACSALRGWPCDRRKKRCGRGAWKRRTASWPSRRRRATGARASCWCAWPGPTSSAA